MLCDLRMTWPWWHSAQQEAELLRAILEELIPWAIGGYRGQGGGVFVTSWSGNSENIACIPLTYYLYMLCKYRGSTYLSMCINKSVHNIYVFHFKTSASWMYQKCKLKNKWLSDVYNLFTFCCIKAVLSFNTFNSPWCLLVSSPFQFLWWRVLP